MNVIHTELEGVLIVEPKVFGDARGFFMESWNARRYEAHGIATSFVQDNFSLSARGVLRGLHFQNPAPQGKLVSVLQGSVFDVAVDLRRGAPTFGKWTAVELSSENRRQLFVPEGFAHGFLVTSETALVHYKCTGFYVPESEVGIRWDYPDLANTWPESHPILSPKDAAAALLRDLPPERLFDYAPVPSRR